MVVPDLGLLVFLGVAAFVGAAALLHYVPRTRCPECHRWGTLRVTGQWHLPDDTVSARYRCYSCGHSQWRDDTPPRKNDQDWYD